MDPVGIYGLLWLRCRCPWLPCSTVFCYGLHRQAVVWHTVCCQPALPWWFGTRRHLPPHTSTRPNMLPNAPCAAPSVQVHSDSAASHPVRAASAPGTCQLVDTPQQHIILSHAAVPNQHGYTAQGKLGPKLQKTVSSHLNPCRITMLLQATLGYSRLLAAPSNPALLGYPRFGYPRILQAPGGTQRPRITRLP